MVAKPLCPLYKNIIKPLDRARYPELRYNNEGVMEEKLSTIYLRDGRNALQYVMSLREKYRQIATEAIFECLRLGYPLNDMEISGKARELLRKRNVIG